MIFQPLQGFLKYLSLIVYVDFSLIYLFQTCLFRAGRLHDKLKGVLVTEESFNYFFKVITLFFKGAIAGWCAQPGAYLSGCKNLQTCFFHRIDYISWLSPDALDCLPIIELNHDVFLCLAEYRSFPNHSLDGSVTCGTQVGEGSPETLEGAVACDILAVDSGVDHLL